MKRLNRVAVWLKLLESGIRPGTARAVHPDDLLQEVGLPWNATAYRELYAWLDGHGFVLERGCVMVAK